MKEPAVDLTITLRNLTKAQAITFVNFAKELELCGKMGRSRYIAFFADGDGDFRPQLEHNLAISEEELSHYAPYCSKMLREGACKSGYDYDDVARVLEKEQQETME